VTNGDNEPRRTPDADASDEQPATDTSTDWDEWMEKHGERPEPVSDIADAEGKFSG
jgi:hypothetical protein